MADASSGEWGQLDAAIEDEAETAFSFLQRLIAAPSTVGSEQGAQQVVAAELARLGFDVTELEVPAQTAASAPGGVAQVSYIGRHNGAKALARFIAGYFGSGGLDGLDAAQDGAAR